MDGDVQDEVELLQAVYPELSVEQGDVSSGAHHIIIPLHPRQDPHVFVMCVLCISVKKTDTSGMVPILSLRNVRGMTEECIADILSKLRKHAEACIGEAMLFNLVELGRDLVTQYNNPQGDCAVCLDSIVDCHYSEQDYDPQSIIHTPCFHLFHEECFHHFASQAPEASDVRCPVCRSTLPPSLIEPYIPSTPPPSTSTKAQTQPLASHTQPVDGPDATQQDKEIESCHIVVHNLGNPSLSWSSVFDALFRPLGASCFCAMPPPPLSMSSSDIIPAPQTPSSILVSFPTTHQAHASQINSNNKAVLGQKIQCHMATQEEVDVAVQWNSANSAQQQDDLDGPAPPDTPIPLLIPVPIPVDIPLPQGGRASMRGKGRAGRGPPRHRGHPPGRHHPTNTEHTQQPEPAGSEQAGSDRAKPRHVHQRSRGRGKPPSQPPQ
eukprot:TRINITY_DN16645_c0_g1_i1.p1 TRINITY_DN16645_c0_g1~~TRINITY_DN16645_c0_g1_i1.p1  ORF type:complete len:436 (+),score=41.63 TRINITY_DN16645_c0_g1_i1:2-1309(+)